MKREYSGYAVSWCVAAATLADCGGSQPALVPSANRAAHKPAAFLYLAQCCQQIFSNHGNITLYDLGLTGVARTITKGVSNPVFISVDRSGRIYYTSWLDYLGASLNTLPAARARLGASNWMARGTWQRTARIISTLLYALRALSTTAATVRSTSMRPVRRSSCVRSRRASTCRSRWHSIRKGTYMWPTALTLIWR
jgi:hypothetical protein